MRLLAILVCLCGAGLSPVRAADALVESAVTALSQLTDPQRLEPLPDDAFRAQLGPALGWLNVARHHDVSPESVIARAFARNGLAGERARLTREGLLRNLARADAWELFSHADSERALADGKPAPIAAGVHRGHLASAAVILPEGLGPRDRREFACLVLRADDENPPRPPPGSHRRQSGDLLARGNVPAIPAASRRPARRASVASAVQAAPDVASDADPLPVAYTTAAGSGKADGTIVVREEVMFGKEVSLAALGGPALRFMLREVNAGSVRFDLSGDQPRTLTVPLAQGQPSNGKARVWRIYEQAGVLSISLYEAVSGSDGNERMVLFEFAPDRREVERKDK